MLYNLQLARFMGGVAPIRIETGLAIVNLYYNCHMQIIKLDIIVPVVMLM